MASKDKGLKNVPPLHVALALLIVMVFVGVGFYFLLYTGMDAEIGKLNKLKADATVRVTELEGRRQNLLKVQDKAARLEKRLEILRSKLPETQEELNLFLGAISQRAQSARVHKWLLFQQHAPEPDDEVARVPISMEFIATYDAATNFFWELSNMGEGAQTGGKEQLVNVSDIALVRATGEDQGLIKVSCRAVTYLYTGTSKPAEDTSRRGGRQRGRR